MCPVVGEGEDHSGRAGHRHSDQDGRKVNIDLSEKEKDEVKKVVHSLLETLKREKLVLDWRKKQQARANVYVTVRDMLHNGLPGAYTQELSRLKCEEVYQHIYDSYYGQGQSVYAKAS